jgi:hypothetical protein
MYKFADMQIYCWTSLVGFVFNDGAICVYAIQGFCGYATSTPALLAEFLRYKVMKKYGE